MHSITFSLKRVYQRSLVIGRELAAPFRLTPARFDMLRAVDTSWLHKADQRDLCRRLGVTAATVSRMLRSLEELGFVQRARSALDRRRRIVWLTARGEGAVRRAERTIVGLGAVECALACGVCRGRGSPGTALTVLFNLESALFTLRRAWGDIADLRYFWHPDD